MHLRRLNPGGGDGLAHDSRGFTLVELMVSLAVLAVLLGMAVPAFNNAALSGKLSGFASSLVASTQIARSEAIKRNKTVTLCASSGGDACDEPARGWAAGWIVILDDGESVVQRQEALPSDFLIEEADDKTTLVFPASVIGATTAAFTICRATPVGKQNRVVTVTASGNTRVAMNDTTTCP
ncbi:MAG TPA: GspH/FimT family pseudopilin [Steroidobacteraceae bacterium]|nr:GspH/FimT family pseudopilin [Steroidobacteraceae bacterium]